MEVIKHVQAIEALLPKLKREMVAANDAGAIQLARAFVVLHRLQKRMLSDKEAFKDFKAFWAECNNKMCPNTFEVSGVDNVPLSEGFRVGISHRTVASILPGKKDDAYTWLLDNEKGDVIQETVNASTLAALAKEMGESNEELPEELFRVERLPYTSVTKT